MALPLDLFSERRRIEKERNRRAARGIWIKKTKQGASERARRGSETKRLKAGDDGK